MLAIGKNNLAPNNSFKQTPLAARLNSGVRRLMRVHHKIGREVFKRDNATCQYCDADLLATFTAYWSATVDHVVAVAAGGVDDPENLRLCCTGCNGLLSRSSGLVTHSERRELVQRRLAEEQQEYREWRAHLGRGAA